MSAKNRAIVIVLDGCGAGEAPDAALFGDIDHPATVRHVWEYANGFHAPNLAECGFLKACGVPVPPDPNACFGRLREISQGKDSVTGHWEMMGIVTDRPFPTYPNGFPAELVSVFEKQIGIQIIGNKAASGTQIISELGPEHVETGKPILYTSADSVFQIATHEEIVPLAQLYEMSEIARKICRSPNNVQRVIARPFQGNAVAGFTRTPNRRDYPVLAPPNLIDEIGDVLGIGPVPELFGGRGFRLTKRTQSNREHETALADALNSDARFIFANFEDFDMLYGHRNDPAGFALALEAFDKMLGWLKTQLKPWDILILTADHGNDPTTASTDHSREYVPIVVIGKTKHRELGDLDGMNAVGATVAAHLGLPFPGKCLIE